MNINDVQILKKPLVLADDTEIGVLESRLWISFPSNYREYITRLGEGVLGGSFVRIYPPWRIDKELGEWRRRISKYWFWEESRELLPKERAVECVIIGDTVDGDELVFHPARPNRLFVLPRHSEKAVAVGSDVLEAVEWICSSGELTEPFDEREFEPFDSRKEARQDTKKEIEDPEGESLEEIVALGKEWAKRRNALEIASEELRAQVKGQKSTLIYESLTLEGKYPHQPGYQAEFRVEDKVSGLEVGTFRWSMTEDSTSSEYAPNQTNIAKLKGKQ